MAVAAAQDPTGARPGLGAPVLTWAPVLELTTGLEGGRAEPTHTFLAGRVGVEAERKVLRARVTLQAATDWTPDGDAVATAGVGEAWARWSPPISSALGFSLTAGQQVLEFDQGVLLGDDDARRTAWRPYALHAQLRAVPWVLDVAGGSAAGAADWVPPTASPRPARDRGFLFARLGGGRDNADTAWDVAAVALALPSDTPVDPTDPVATGGVTFSVQLNRLRFGGDGYVQPADSGVALMTGGRVGWALGDEARVVVWGGADHLSGGTAPVFRRPLAAQRDRFGTAGLYDAGGAREADGLVDGWLRLDATIAPQLRTRAAVHHAWDGAARPVGPELDAELSWMWSPLAALRLRGAWAQPWANAAPDVLRGEVGIDVAL